MRDLNVDIVVSRVDEERFTGGTLCIFHHAQRLSAFGHNVRVIPLVPSPDPTWFPNRTFDYLSTERASVADALRVGGRLLRRLGSREGLSSDLVGDVADSLATAAFSRLPHEYKRAFAVRHLRGLVGEADVTVATSYETVLPVVLNVAGPKVYFMQHYEPLFFDDAADCRTPRLEATASYCMDVKLVANSSWLQKTIGSRTGRTDVEICLNAIDLEEFHPATGRPANPTDRPDALTVISYGGRDAEWKGFREMSHAVAQVRRERPGVLLHWKVYGGALLPPDNPIASYDDLGRLDQRRLGDAYRGADILLSASWYESFPLFPLEAMACGTATITSASGTEEYARHGRTAHVVEPRDVRSIAAGLLRLVDDHSYRRRLGRAGAAEARRFGWDRAAARMDRLLRDVGAAGGGPRTDRSDHSGPRTRPGEVRCSRFPGRS